MTPKTPTSRLTGAAALALTLFLASCNDSDSTAGTLPPGGGGPAASLAGIDLTGGPWGIVDLPSTVDARILALFSRYTAVEAANGDRIHLLAQGGVSDELIFRTRGMLSQHLTDVDGPTSTIDKTAVVEALVAGDSTFAILTDATTWDPLSEDVVALTDLFGDALETVRADLMVQEGSAAYVLPSPAIDPTLGAAAGFVLRRGLSTALPSFQTELDAATDDALLMGRFTAPVGTETARVDDAYLALALDVYSGVWGHDPRGDGTAGENGEYAYCTRDEMELGDPVMVAVIESFFSPYNTYAAYLDDAFAQTFEMEYTAVLPYTHRSRYLERVGLREGGQAARVNGNDLDNVFVGNAADNVWQGRGGNDASNMLGGNDTLHFEGTFDQYVVTETVPGIWRIEDTVLNRDGIDDTSGATELVFSDQTVTL